MAIAGESGRVVGQRIGLLQIVPCDCRRWIAKTLARMRERERVVAALRWVP